MRFRETADKMWEEFVEPIKRGEYGTRNFSSLYVLKRDMFRTEENIVDMVVRGDREEGGGGVGVVNSKSELCLSFFGDLLPLF